MRRILLAAHYASERHGGEAAIPLRLYDELRSRGQEVWLASHDSDAEELRDRFADEPERLILTGSLRGMAPLFPIGERLPDGPRAVVWAATQIERQIALAARLRQVIPLLGIDVVHQPIGIAPSVPSPLTRLGAPLVVGPLNGGMVMPPAFRTRDSTVTRLTQRARRPLGAAAHRVFTGKLGAAAVLVANERTAALLPRAARARTVWMPESAVALEAWPMKDRRLADEATPTRFVFVGRLVPYKSPDLIVRAFSRAAAQIDARLDIVGDGPLRAELEALAKALGVGDKVRFLGWRTRAESSDILRAADAFVYASLREPGGTVVLEAMASGLPCIVADWGGPAEYVADGTGIRVAVDSYEILLGGICDAMVRLSMNPQLRFELGAAARDRVSEHYDWRVLAARLVDIYEQVASDWSPSGRPSRA